MKTTKNLVALALTAMVIPMAGAATLIDGFDLPVPAVTLQILNDPNPQVINTSLPGGTSRSVTFQVTSPVVFNSLSGGIGGGMLAAGFNALSFGNVSLAYTFGSTLDLSGDAMLEIVSAGSAGVAASIVVRTATGNLTLNSTLPSAGALTPQTYFYSAFTGTGDRAQVTGLDVVFTGAASSNFIVDSIVSTPAPEPGTALSLLLALPALAVLRKRAAR